MFALDQKVALVTAQGQETIAQYVSGGWLTEDQIKDQYPMQAAIAEMLGMPLPEFHLVKVRLTTGTWEFYTAVDTGETASGSYQDEDGWHDILGVNVFGLVDVVDVDTLANIPDSLPVEPATDPEL